MDGTSGWIEVVVLAALALFVAWRLVSVLGSRTGHEPPPVDMRAANPETSSDSVTDIFTRRPRVADAAAASRSLPASLSDDLRTKLQQVEATDPSFDYARFLDGARAAYPLILQAFWQKDIATLRPLLADEVLEGFKAAMADLTTAPHFERLHDAQIIDASVVAASLQVVVRYMATIATTDGQITSEDIWTFSRHARSDDPNWLLAATDDTIGA